MRNLVSIVIVFVVAWAAAAAWTQDGRSRERDRRDGRDERSPSRSSFDSFRIVLDRNIFDPNRRARQPYTRPTPRPRPALPPPTERISLRGALIHETATSQVVVAFFDGSRSEYNATVKPGDTIGGFRAAAVGTSRVILEKDGRRFDLPIGSGLRRQGDEPWEVVSASETSTSRAPISRTPDTTATSGTARVDSSSASGSGGSGGAATTQESSGDSPSEVLKRLMERRRQELK